MSSEMDRLPSDLVEEILVRLPTRFLFQFKCVSKRYLFMISNPTFVDRYRRSRPPLARLILQPFVADLEHFTPEKSLPRFLLLPSGDKAAEGGDENYSLDALFAFFPQPHLYEAWAMGPAPSSGVRVLDCPLVVSASRGLLLCTRVSRTPSQYYYVCNPADRKWVALPRAPNNPCHYNAQLYFPETEDHFKVVQFPLAKRYNSDVLEVQVFSSEFGKWSNLDYYHPAARFRKFSPLATINGVIYWIDAELQDRVLAYHIDNHYISFFPLPVASEVPRVHCLGQSCGLLYYARFNLVDIQVWALHGGEGSDQSWSLKHSVSLDAMVEANDHFFKFSEVNIIKLSFYYFQSLAFHPLDEQVLVFKLPEMIVFYNMKKGILEKGWNCEPDFDFCSVIQYVHPAWPVHFPSVKNALRAS